MAAELFLIRHPRAYRPRSATFGEMYGLTPEGVKQAQEVGKHLLKIVGGVTPHEFERATSKRSAEAAKIIAGTSGIPTEISAQEAFNRTGFTPDQIRTRMSEWTLIKRESGVYVAVMSRAAIVWCIGGQLGWSEAEAMDVVVSTDNLEIPTGSVTHITVHPESPELIVHYYGCMPEAINATDI